MQLSLAAAAALIIAATGIASTSAADPLQAHVIKVTQPSTGKTVPEPSYCVFHFANIDCSKDAPPFDGSKAEVSTFPLPSGKAAADIPTLCKAFGDKCQDPLKSDPALVIAYYGCKQHGSDNSVDAYCAIQQGASAGGAFKSFTAATAKAAGLTA